MRNFFSSFRRRLHRTIHEILDPDGTVALREIAQLAEWRPIGSYVQFGGALARVDGHYLAVESSLYGPPTMRPTLLLSLDTESGKRIRLQVGRTMALALMKEQPAKVSAP
jgi:hypothetical protein